MPIDFARIAEQFRPPISAQMQTISRAFERLGRWLATRRRAFEELERSSRVFPVIRFYNEAVTLMVTEQQRGGLDPGAVPPSLGEGLMAGGAAFARGIQRVGTAIREDLILPRFFGMLRSIVAMILASVERFNPARADMFDIRSRSASDLFGEAGLMIGALGQSRIQIQRVKGWIAMAGQRWKDAFGRPAPAPVSSAAPDPVSSDFDSAGLLGAFDTGVQAISGALLLVPLLPQVLGTIIRAALLRVKFSVVTLLQGVEARLFQLRQQVIDLFSVQLLSFLGTAQSFLTAAAVLVLQNLRFYLGFGGEYVVELLNGLRRFLRGFSRLVNYWQQMITRIFESIDAVLNFDLMPLILAALGLPGRIIALIGSPPPLTIADLLGLYASVGRISARAALNIWLNALETILRGAEYITDEPHVAMVRRRVAALADLMNVALQPMATYPTFTRPPAYSGANFPNIYDAFFGGPAAVDLRRRLAAFQGNAIGDIGGILGAGAELLGGLGTAFDRSSDEAARLGSPRRYQRLAEDATRLAETALGDQVAELSRRGAQESANPVAASFERWLINGGFELIGAAIPLYINEMRRYWHAVVAEETADAASGTLPTSPHILARRVQLGAVRVPGLTIRAHGRDLNDELVAMIATRFRSAVAEAYHTGERVLGVETP